MVFGRGLKPDGEKILLTTPRRKKYRKSPVLRALGALATCLAVLTPSLTETAVANGDTRTIYLHHAHTGEDIAATYLVNGQYDSNVLRQLNWFLRDWRRDEPTNMDPRLFDVVWEAYRSAGAGNQIINVVSAYRSPETNAMLRARSRAVAKYSQHMLGKAMDTTMPGMPMSHIREIGMRMQRGGVGYYPTAGTPFVHLDVGNVRHWPRMSYDQLVRLFPDGKTVHLPTNGQPLARYEEARAEIEARGNGAYVTAPRRTFGGFFAMLFGGGAEEDDSEVAAPPPSTRKQWASLAPRTGRGAKVAETDEESGAAPAPEPASRRGRGQQIARAEENLPRGETTMSAPGVTTMSAPAAETAPEQAQEPQQEQEKTKPTPTARIPLPPARRPASLDNKPAPLETEESPAAVASLESGAASGLRNSTEPQESEAPELAPAHKFVNAPFPPRRPALLVASTASAPLPPARPSALQTAASGHGDANATHAIAKLVNPEKGAARAAKESDESPLAYVAPTSEKPQQSAETAKPQKPAAAKPEQRATTQRTDLVPARLDRSNFNTLTGATPASRAAARSVTGAPIGALRAAARAAEPSVLAPPQRPAHIVGFAPPDATPPTNKFAPGAKRAQ